MSIKKTTRNFLDFLKQDTWQSWTISIILIILLIKLILFPVLSLATGSPLPMVVVESCSMYHESSFDSWWESNSGFYESKEISKSDFASFPLKNGLNKGDIVFVWGRSEYRKGDVIIFRSETKYPLIHRIMSLSPLSTKGDHNLDQLSLEKNISKDALVGKAVGKIPLLGWIKLIFFEPFKEKSQQGFCK